MSKILRRLALLLVTLSQLYLVAGATSCSQSPTHLVAETAD
jgi:hypothetical protein